MHLTQTGAALEGEAIGEERFKVCKDKRAIIVLFYQPLCKARLGRGEG